MTSQARAVNPETAARAVQRCLHLLQVLDREHSSEEAHKTMRAVRSELQTAGQVLPEVGDIWTERILRRSQDPQPSLFEE